MPNFFIVGAQKAGTTSLYHYLSQHPQVYMSPVKEPFFFDHEMTAEGEILPHQFRGHRQAPRFANLEEYASLFKTVGDEKAVGEASPLYLYAPGTAERIAAHAPGARAIALLRNPADRAYSAFLHAVRIGVEPLTDFARALDEEDRRIREGWHFVFHYRNRGLYHAQVSRYYEVFGRERVGVWLYDDLRDDPAAVARGAFRFLGVDDTFAADTQSRYNPAGVPEGRTARALVRATNQAVGTLGKVLPPTSRVFPLAYRARDAMERRVFTRPPPIDPTIRAELVRGYRDDILRLQDLIGRDLSSWLDDGPREAATGG